jgi:hypothetical protein
MLSRAERRCSAVQRADCHGVRRQGGQGAAGAGRGGGQAAAGGLMPGLTPYGGCAARTIALHPMPTPLAPRVRASRARGRALRRACCAARGPGRGSRGAAGAACFSRAKSTTFSCLPLNVKWYALVGWLLRASARVGGMLCCVAWGGMLCVACARNAVSGGEKGVLWLLRVRWRAAPGAVARAPAARCAGGASVAPQECRWPCVYSDVSVRRPCAMLHGGASQ